MPPGHSGTSKKPSPLPVPRPPIRSAPTSSHAPLPSTSNSSISPKSNHRKRRRRAGLLETSSPPQSTIQRGSLRGTLRRLREAGHTRESVLALLRQICVTPVFTAHPTEVARRSVMFKRRRISELLEALDTLGLPSSELDRLQDDLLAEITALWQTDDVRMARPTVRDEIRMGLDYYEASLFSTVPVLYAEIASALDAEFPTETRTTLIDLPIVLRFGSWIGGDRDGNPFVIAQTTAEAAGMARDLPPPPLPRPARRHL